MMSSNGNIFRVTDPLWGKSNRHRWISLKKASDAELWYFLWSTPEQMFKRRHFYIETAPGRCLVLILQGMMQLLEFWNIVIHMCSMIRRYVIKNDVISQAEVW